MAPLLQKLAEYEKAKSTPAPSAPAFDPRDPVGSLQKMGADVDYTTKVLVANALRANGQPVPPQLEMLAQWGPQTNATNALQSQVETLSRQLSMLAETQTKAVTRESFKASVADKSKYPHLAKAYAANPALFEGKVDAHKGNADELAAAIETELKAVAESLGHALTASDEDADDDDDNESSNVDPATQGSNGELPPAAKPVDKSGLWTEADHIRTRDEIVKKYGGSISGQ